MPIPNTPGSENLKKRWLSPSSINAYLKCPRSFYYSRIAKLKQKPSIHLVRGIAVHGAIYHFYKHNFHRCPNMDYGDLRRITIDLLKDEWTNQQQAISQLDLTQDEVTFYYEESTKMILNFLHDFLHERGFEKPSPILEKTLFLQSHRLLGRIDIIYNQRGPPLLVDFKTSKSKELTEEYKRQLAIYALLHKHAYNTIPRLGIHFLKFRPGLQTFTITDNQLEKIQALVMNIHEKTQSDAITDYPCTCGWCHKNFSGAK